MGTDIILIKFENQLKISLRALYDLAYNPSPEDPQHVLHNKIQLI